MSVVAVVTSSPPVAEGGHLVMARALVGALREAGHHADLVITQQNRFGRNVSTYLSNWMLDIGRTAEGRSVDQVLSLRWPSYAVRHPVHVLQAARMGADVATLPLSVIEALARHPLTDIGIQKFLKDWEKVPKSQKPTP